jgi:predicted RNA-binding Zn ribbon-like protein
VEWLCLDFINSDWRDWRGSGQRTDKLDDAEWLKRFMNKWSLHASLPLEADIRRELAELRELMRTMAEASAEGSPYTEDQIALLNEAIRSVDYQYGLVWNEARGVTLEQEPLGEGWQLAIGRIALSFGELLTGEEASRLRICDNPSCRWVFHDSSRNRSKRWCDDKCCGNLMKVRRFRARHKESGLAGETDK